MSYSKLVVILKLYMHLLNVRAYISTRDFGQAKLGLGTMHGSVNRPAGNWLAFVTLTISGLWRRLADKQATQTDKLYSRPTYYLRLSRGIAHIVCVNLF